MQATLHLSVPGRFSHSLSVAMLLTLKRMAMMDPRIEWQEAEEHPYALSGKPCVGPDAVLNTSSCASARSGKGSLSIRPRSTVLATKCSWRVGSASRVPN